MTDLVDNHETLTRDLTHAVLYRRPDTTGEMPRLIAPALFGMRPDVTARIVTTSPRDAYIHSGEIAPYSSYSPEPGEPPRPIPKPPTPPPPAAPTEVLSLLDSLAGDPPPPRPLPAPGPPPRPSGFVPRHRAIEPVWAWAAAGAGAMLILIAVLVSSILAVRL